MRAIFLAMALAAAGCDTLDWRGAGEHMVGNLCDEPGACSAYCRERAVGPAPRDCR